jgi:hypothetical protein
VVEPGQMPRVGEGVGRVRVHLEQQLVAETLTDRAHRLDVPAGLDLQLDAHVAFGEIAVDGVEEPGDTVHDPDGDPARDPATDGAEGLAERTPFGTQFGVENRHLQRRLGHAVALERGEPARDGVGGQRPGRHEGGNEEPAEHVRRAVDVLRGIERAAHRHGFAPALDIGVGHDVNEKDVTDRLGAERGPERRHQRHRDAPQLDSGELH